MNKFPINRARLHVRFWMEPRDISDPSKPAEWLGQFNLQGGNYLAPVDPAKMERNSVTGQRNLLHSGSGPLEVKFASPGNTCREVFNDILSKSKFKAGLYPLYDRPTELGLAMGVVVGPDGKANQSYYTLNPECYGPVAEALGRLRDSLEERIKLAALLDSLIGPLAVLFGHKDSFQMGDNKTLVLDFTEGMRPGFEKTCNLTCLLRYRRLDGFWLRHPAVASLVWAALRIGFDAYTRGDYDLHNIDDAVKKLQKRAVLYSKRSHLEEKPLQKLTQKFSELLGRGQIDYGATVCPQSYPICVKNIPLILQLREVLKPDLKLSDHVQIRELWNTKGAVYANGPAGGFYSWCWKNADRMKDVPKNEWTSQVLAGLVTHNDSRNEAVVNLAL